MSMNILPIVIVLYFLIIIYGLEECTYDFIYFKDQRIGYFNFAKSIWKLKGYVHKYV